MLRSIRYAEADRVLHLYSRDLGRLNAIAKGARRPRSRFGGRLEPFFRLDLVLYRGRGELATVTAAHTVAAHAEPARERARRWAPRRAPATRCCGCSTRTRRTPPPTTCCAATWRCSTATSPAAAARRPCPRSTAPPVMPRRSRSGSSWRWRPASRPSSARARAAARRTGWPASRPTPAGSSARPASAAASSSPARRTRSWSRRSAARWRRPRPARPRALRQAERAVTETLEHHAHVHLRAAA